MVRNIGSPLALRTAQDAEDFEQEIVDQYALAMAAAGLSDGHVSAHPLDVIVEFARSLVGPLWAASCEDADRFLADQRRAGRAVTTRAGKAGVLASFYEFVISRYQGDIHAAVTGVVVDQPIDEFNRQQGASLGKVRVPPSDAEVEELFAGWRACAAEARKYLPAARDYFAASLWRRLGLRINETVMLDIRDWRPDLGELGKLHVRHGKGSRGRGPKARLVPAINGADTLDRLVAGRGPPPVRRRLVRPRRADAAQRAPRPRPATLPPGWRRRAAPRAGGQTARWLPPLVGPAHAARAASLLRLLAVWRPGWTSRRSQELLGHQWLSTTSGYIHVRERPHRAGVG